MSSLDSETLRDDIIAEMIGHDESLPLNKSRYAEHIQELVGLLTKSDFDDAHAVALSLYSNWHCAPQPHHTAQSLAC